ncbi:hypothetical protein G7059_03755 [Erysipelothrix sp. HDW6A]|uniref:hypothetical protein n=1 Tax=Erysipelothrix sp. HDW6A TaxID=2714928 RepID=UPI00140BD838|nr:hypothetical protein [Erysipelothrix sp. HDW6A]QIK57027.1 hypothetical protein G7059_03755 [Erysipelothrix sp. HDW6A]
MPNLCFFNMQVKGKPKDLKTVNEILNADYNYENNKLISCSAEKHIFRTWDIESSFDENLEVSGHCAWSVYSCMMEGPYTYYNQLKTFENFKGTTLVEISQTYNVDIEVYSEEPGMCFQEHYLIRNGVVEVDEETPYYENYNEKTGEYESQGGFGTWETWKFSI